MEWFKYNGIRSDAHGIRIYNQLDFTVPVTETEELTIKGRDGVLLIDQGRLPAIEKSILFDVKVPMEGIERGDGSVLHAQIMEISNWLGVKGWHDWEWSMYPGYRWKATINDPYTIADSLRWMGRGAIRVLFHPIMYVLPITEQTVTSGQNLQGRGTISAKPLIKITGSGASIMINLNGQPWISLINLNGSITIDSESMQVYDSNGSATSKMGATIRPLFPRLTTGSNVITFPASVTSFKITPRWAVRAT